MEKLILFQTAKVVFKRKNIVKINGSRATKWIDMIKDMIAAVYNNLQ